MDATDVPGAGTAGGPGSDAAGSPGWLEALERALGVSLAGPEFAASIALAVFAAGLGAAWQRGLGARERWLALLAGSLAGLLVVILDDVLLADVPVQPKAAAAGLVGHYAVGFVQSAGAQVIASSAAIVQAVLARLGLGGDDGR